MSGRLKPGEHIREAHLSAELGISRGTLREALRSIENEGLLDSDGKGHVRVRRLSHREIADVFEVRTALEILAASRLATGHRRAEHAAALEAALQPLRRDDLTFGERMDVDLGFHEQLCELTGNEPLVACWRLLIGPIRMIIAAGAERAVERMSIAGHLEIIESIRSGDVDAVCETLTSHMADFARRYLADPEPAGAGAAERSGLPA